MDGCIFCKIASKDIPSEHIYEMDDFFVIKDINPQAPVHLLIVSKEHIQSINETESRHRGMLGEMFLQAKALATKFGLENGYKLVINCGPDGGQVVPHLHIHVLGGKKLSGLV